MPSPHEDDAAQVFVKTESKPDSEQSESTRYSEQPCHSHGHCPLADDANTHRINGIACCPECPACKDILHSSITQEEIYTEYPCAGSDDVLIVGEEGKQGMSANGKYGRNDERQYCCHAIDIVAE